MNSNRLPYLDLMYSDGWRNKSVSVNQSKKTSVVNSGKADSIFRSKTKYPISSDDYAFVRQQKDGDGSSRLKKRCSKLDINWLPMRINEEYTSNYAVDSDHTHQSPKWISSETKTSTARDRFLTFGQKSTSRMRRKCCRFIRCRSQKCCHWLVVEVSIYPMDSPMSPTIDFSV